MRTKHWLVSVLAVMMSWITLSVLADEQLDAPPKKAPKSAAPAASSAKAALPEAPLTAPEPAVVKEKNVNVRGQANINSEIVTRLKRGDQVMVLEEITLKKPKTDEPARWYKVTLPTGSFVWVHGAFVDPTTKAVVPARLNMRSGPGENYSIVGRITKGTVVKDMEKKGDWLKIEAPAEAVGFVAAHLLERQPVAAAPVVAAAPPPAPKPAEPVVPPPAPIETNVVVTPPPPVPAEPVVTPTPATPPPQPVSPVIVTPAAPVTPVEPEAPVEEIKRMVTREGLVKKSVSIQAPTYFVLSSLDNKRVVNYLFSPSTNIVLKDFYGKRVQVTGEEGLDERWPNMPVLTVETLQELPYLRETP